MNATRVTWAAEAVAAAWVGLQVYVGVTGFRDVLLQRPLHLAFAIAIASTVTAGATRSRRLLCAGLAGAAFIPTVYLIAEHDQLLTRVPFISTVTTVQLLLGLAMIAALLEATRRLLGLSLVIVVLTFVAYGFAGPLLPGLLRHPGMDVDLLIEINFLSTDGIFGVPIGVSSSVVFYFILFALALKVSGSGRLIMDLAVRVFGRTTSGPAKAAVAASAMTGSLNGSAIGNVMSTGVFTIPLMRDSGLPRRTAAGIEAVASTGGQLVPPVMGAAAFTMAELTGIPYPDIVRQAIVPALLIYLSLFVIVHYEGRRAAATSMLQQASQVDRVRILPRAHLLVGPAVLATAFIAGYSLSLSALAGAAATVVLGLVRRQTRSTISQFLTEMATTAVAAARVAVACGAAGIVIGIIVQTGLGLRLSTQLSEVSSISLVIALLIVMVAAIVMGIGMPTTAAYIISAMLLAPGLVELGVPTLTAHMFVFMFAILAMVTPPIALAAYAAASIADCSANATGLTAFRYALAGFVVPFALVYNTNLSPDAGLAAVLPALLAAALGTVLIGAGVAGYLRASLRHWERAALVLAGAGLVLSFYVLTAVLAVVLVQYLIQRWRGGASPVADRSTASAHSRRLRQTD